MAVGGPYFCSSAEETYVYIHNSFAPRRGASPRFGSRGRVLHGAEALDPGVDVGRLFGKGRGPLSGAQAVGFPTKRSGCLDSPLALVILKVIGLIWFD